MISKARPRHRPPGDILLVSLRRRPRLRLHRQVGEGQAEGADQVCRDYEFAHDQPSLRILTKTRVGTGGVRGNQIHSGVI